MTAGEGESGLARRFGNTLDDGCRHLNLLYLITSFTNQKLRWLMLMITCNVRASDVLVRRIQAVSKLIGLQEFKNAIHRHGQQVIAKLISAHIRQLIGGYRLSCDQKAFKHLTALSGQLTAQCKALLMRLSEDTLCRLLIYGNHLI